MPITKDILMIKSQIKKFITETAMLDKEEVKDETLIFDEGIFDSMGFLSLINYIEKEFNIKAEDSELLEENFESVNTMVNYITKKMSN
jgi:acyl carrier protein